MIMKLSLLVTVRQGYVLSPLFFNLYINESTVSLEQDTVNPSNTSLTQAFQCCLRLYINNVMIFCHASFFITFRFSLIDGYAMGS